MQTHGTQLNDIRFTVTTTTDRDRNSWLWRLSSSSSSLQQTASWWYTQINSIIWYPRVSVKLRVAAKWMTTETSDSRCCRSASPMPRPSAVISPATGMTCREKWGFSTPNLPNTCNTHKSFTATSSAMDNTTRLFSVNTNLIISSPNFKSAKHWQKFGGLAN